MKEVLFLCPNISAFENMKEEVQYPTLSKIKEFFQPFINNGFAIKYLVEDSLAAFVLENIDAPKIPITCVEEADRQFHEMHPELTLWSADISFEDATSTFSAGLKYPKVNIRDFEKKEDFYKERGDLAKKRTKDNTQALLQQSNYSYVIYGRHSTVWKSLTTEVYPGDGRLYTEWDWTEGVYSSFYGGFWVDKETVNTILTMEGQV